MILLTKQETRFVASLGLLSLLCIILFTVRIVATGSFRYLFIPGNLTLVWLALIFAWLLTKQLKVQRWLSWQNLTLSGLWLFLLPNTWYVLTDFIHVQPTSEISQLYDVVLISTLVMCGFIAGFTSLYLIHLEFLKRLGRRVSTEIVMAIIFVSSFAIYLGRALRWNSWDLITDPGGLIINISDRVLDPFGYPRALNITVLFFILLSTIYLSIWLFLQPSRSK